MAATRTLVNSAIKASASGPRAGNGTAVGVCVLSGTEEMVLTGVVGRHSKTGTVSGLSETVVVVVGVIGCIEILDSVCVEVGMLCLLHQGM